MTVKSDYPDFIEFPNGKGLRECSTEYGEMYRRALSIQDEHGYNSEAYPAALYNEYHTLRYRMDNMQCDPAHLGEVVWYDKAPRNAA